MAKYDETQTMVIEKVMAKYNGEISRSNFEKFYKEFVDEYGDDFSERSLASKIRSMGYKVEAKGKVIIPKQYTEQEEAVIRELCKDPENLPFQEDIADKLGKETKSIGGKLISMGIYGVKKRDLKAPAEKLFTEADEAVIMEMIKGDSDVFIEDIAEKVGKSVKQVRGKLAGMRVKGVKTRNKVAAKPKVYTEEVVAGIKADIAKGMSLEDIAKARGLNERGMQTTLTRLGVLAKKAKKVFWTDEKVAKLASLAAKGTTLDDAAKALSTTIMVIGKRARQDNLEFIKPEKVEKAA
jgi:hypothetical protein